MNAAAVEPVIRERLGIDPASLGPAVAARAVEARMRETDTPTVEAYLALVHSPAELSALAAELAVSETWFFRGGRRLFDGLADFLVGRAGRGAGQPARVLSTPCSTGEEPYSLAVALHERLVPPDAVRIEGVDVSPASLIRAASARFPDSSFREPGVDPRPAHFRHTAGRWELHPPLRPLVRFRAGNMTDPTFLAGEPAYDLIFCRNLFIYLTADGRKRAMANLDRLLAPDGRLCLSAAEADRLPAGKFVTDGPNEFCVYRRGESAAAAAGFRPTLPALAPPTGGVKSGVTPRPPLPPPQPAPAVTPPPAARWTLAEARALADAGELAAAREACEVACAAAPASADGYALLGAILQAEGDAVAAGNAFRKALYLTPDHPDALSHLIVLADRRGDATQAEAFRRRLARLTARGGNP